MKRKSKTCYRCEKKATSREHFPPSSFFPNKGAGLQLKTVASCEIHNNLKSKDDQYVLAHICLNTSRNGANLPFKRFLESTLPQLKCHKGFWSKIVKDSIDLENGARAYQVDTDRFDNFFDNLVGAIYFDKFKSTLSLEKYNLSHIYMNFESEDSPNRIFGAGFLEEFKSKHPYLFTRIESDKIDESVYLFEMIAPVGTDASITIVHTFYGTFDVVSMLTHKTVSDAVKNALFK